MRQTRLSIGCQDWQEITAKIGPAATGVLLYLRLTMRNMQASEITISTAELAEALKLDAETVGNLLCMILDAELLDAVPGPDGLTTYQSKEEAAALADRFRKRASSSRRKLAAMSANLIPYLSGNSGPEIPAEIPEYTFFDNNGQSADSPKEVESEVAMYYHPGPGEPRDESSYYFRKKKEKGSHTLFNHTGQESKKEKNPPTPKKEKSLTEFTGPAHASTPAHAPDLPTDQLEADYIDVIGTWPDSLREALRNETPDVREAFYLYVRTRQAEDGKAWSADKVRIAWLAARRIPAERRADSILAASMGGWKTIRDSGSGVYFEKSTGRIVSLVRGPVEPVSPRGGTASSAAREFARRMREE